MTRGKWLPLIFMAAILTGLSMSANVYRPADTSKSELKTKTLDLDDEASVEDSPGFKPFFYASTAPGSGEDEASKEDEHKDTGTLDKDSVVPGKEVSELSEEDLKRMIDEVVKEVRTVESLERGFPFKDFWNPLLEPDYPHKLPEYDYPPPALDYRRRSPNYFGPRHHFGGDRFPYRHLFRRPLPAALKYSDYGFLNEDACPPCSCDHEDDDDYEGEYDDDEEDQEDYGFDFDPTYRYDRRGRSKRSVGDYWKNIGSDYWNSIVPPSEHLGKYNVGYRIKNDLRKRIQASRYWPLHYGYVKKSKHSTLKPKSKKKGKKSKTWL